MATRTQTQQTLVRPSSPFPPPQAQWTAPAAENDEVPSVGDRRDDSVISREELPDGGAA
jgi:hypothetical protein